MDALVGLFTEWWKRRWGKYDEKMKLRRAALEQLLKLAQRVQNEVVGATLVAGSFRDGRIDHDTFLERFPDLLSILAEGDLSNDLRLQLSNDLYGTGAAIHQGVEALRNLILFNNPREAKTSDEYMARSRRCLDLMVNVQEAAHEWVNIIERELKKTF